MGLKIGTLLELKWKDLIDTDTDESRLDLIVKGGKLRSIRLSHFIQRITQGMFASLYDADNVSYKTPIYANRRTGKALTTSNLNKELSKFYTEFKAEVELKTGLLLDYPEPKSGTFQIAWARDMVKQYNYTKKSFIAISKYMGHKSVQDTVSILQMQPNDEITLRFDLFNPDVKKEIEMEETLKYDNKLKEYLQKNVLNEVTIEFLSEQDGKPFASLKGRSG